MGQTYTAICGDCGHRFQVSEGGGFTFHLLHCDKCGRTKTVSFSSLGELHLRFLKELPGPYAIATEDADALAKKKFKGKPISEAKYEAEIEKRLRLCRCKGKYRFGASPRCPKCHSVSFSADPKGEHIMYYD